MSIPLDLRQAMEAGECVLFLGAGIGHYCFNEEGNHAPDAMGLLTLLKEKFDINDDSKDLTKVTDYIEYKHGRVELETCIRESLSGYEPNETIKWLTSNNWKAIYTTNYDNYIQKAYNTNMETPQSYVTITATSEIKDYKSKFEVPIFHLHGSLFSSEKTNIIITERDYIKYKKQRMMLFELLKLHIATGCILYIGYSNNDSNWNKTIEEISEEFYPKSLPNSYRVSPETSNIEEEILKRKNVNTLHYSLEEFVFEVMPLLTPNKKIDTETIKIGIPTHFQSAFEKNPAAVYSLLSAWECINIHSFTEKPNIREFFRGDKANWALIAQQKNFLRDIEEEAYDSILDFATSITKNPRISMILGPAGYGMSTLLKSLAVNAVRDKAGFVFFLKDNQELRQNDVEFAISLYEEQMSDYGRPIFFVDNAADYVNEIKNIHHRCKENTKTAMFFLGERKNEWLQLSPRIFGNVFELTSLSDNEIYRLLDALKANGELNKLKELKEEMQFAAIKENYRSELLVTIREATEDKKIEAIIEDEYRGINNDLSKQLYLLVCGFYQYGTIMRDQLFAKIMNEDISNIYEKTKDSLEGVIKYESYDSERGIFIARARHRIIAAIVWERCGSLSEKEHLIIQSINSLNLSYSIDIKAFEKFIRDDRFVDTLSSLERKIMFFEKAVSKAPDSPYVRQHYSRMLMREHKYELALEQIEIAIGNSTNPRVFYHTKGLILSKMALEKGSSVEIARRRLIQSEDSFKRAKSINENDEYSYQGLAQLYRGWAERMDNVDDNEKIEYLQKAEDIIGEGLKKVRNREGLLIESAYIEKIIGDEKTIIQALEKAVRDVPKGIISRYLLARAYHNQQRYDDALKVLEPVISMHFEEYRCFLQYARALVYLQKNREAIAILEQSRLYGLSDPYYIATLGGLLVLEKNFTRADVVFKESEKLNGTEVSPIRFFPPDSSDLTKNLTFQGTVKVVRAGFSLIQPSEYPEFLCPASKYNGVILRENMGVIFEVGFSARGRMAINPIPC